MDYIRQALNKANVTLGASSSESQQARRVPSHGERPNVTAGAVEEASTSSWSLREVAISPARMKRNRIISFGKSTPEHIAFDLLRTRIRAVASENHWKSIGVTSPTPGCGKTTVAINLALSLARAPDCRVVLVDLDLKKPSIAKLLGVKPLNSLGNYLGGTSEAADCFVQIQPNLFVGLTGEAQRDSSELLQSKRMSELLNRIESELRPELVIFDLPPMGTGDDVLAFVPQIDATLLVAAAGTTTVAEINECDRQLSQVDRFLGVVFNKARNRGKAYYSY